ncbi:AMP-binding protein [Paenibacillus chitinolyticus]|uniref:AMP-binding protein n=1 Tax=Paenibacillus chitinolyticus TaxID=79263 RepID=UPI0035592916
MINQLLTQEDALSIFYNLKGREYVGSKFSKSPRPERHKNFEGPYTRLKTSVFNKTNEDMLPKTGLSILEQVLLSSFSVTSVKFYGYQSEMLWSFPSAGGCYPVDVYVIVRSLDGVEPGIYYYSPLNTSLHKIACADSLFLLDEAILPQDQDADYYIMVSAVPWRSCWKYSHRGYRFSFIDAGHVLANFQTIFHSLGVNFTTYTACKDQHIKTLLHLDSHEEPVGIIAVKQHETKPLAVQQAYRGNYQSRCITTFDSGLSAFDWEPIRLYQEKVRQSLQHQQPSEDWTVRHHIPAEWNDYNEMLRLIIERRSSSSYLPVEIPRHDFIRLLEFVNSLGMPIRIFCVVHAVEGMIPGTYEFNGSELKMIKAGDFRARSTQLCFDQEFVHDSSVLFFFAIDKSQVNDKNFYTYQQRLVDMGILAQMIYLKSGELKLGYSAIGGYYDEEAKELFNLGENMDLLYSGTLGKDDVNSAFKVKMDRYYLNKPKDSEEVKGDSPAQNGRIIDKLYEAVLKYGPKEAIRYADESYTYHQFWNQVEKTGAWIKQQIPKQYPVGISMKNCPNYLFAYYGLLLEGYIPMLIDHTFTQDEVDNLCSYYNIGSLLTLDGEGRIQVQLRDENFDSFDEDEFANVATCRFSSGTTGRPKCLMFTHDAVINAGVNWAKASGITSADNVQVTALFHNGLAFNTSLLAVFVSGACLFIAKQITPKSIWETVMKENISILVAFPVVYDLLNNSKYCKPEHNLRLCLSSAAPLHYAVKQSFLDKTGMEICDYYGIVEAGPCTFNNGSKEASLGTPVPGVDIRIVNEEGFAVADGESGIIQVRSSSMAKGYYKASFPFVISPDGYYQTTDRGFIESNHLHINGRSSDMINVAGKKMDPLEVENVLLKLSGVQDVAVVGIMNERKTTEYPVAFVVLDPGVTIDDLIAHCQQYLAPFKLPQKFVTVDSIPRSGVGKIKRKELADSLS